MPVESRPHIVIIGAGSTGAAAAHDLALRGLQVTVVERGDVASGTTGRNHCLLHSGARYCVTDQPSAIECIRENWVLRRIMPHALELNDGLFVALDDADMAYKEKFLAGTAECGIPTQELSVEQALKIEPFLNPRLRYAIQVPDGVFEPWRFCAAFLATAKKNGALLRTFTLVTDLVFSARSVAGVRVHDYRTGKDETLGADLVVNAAGVWAGALAQMANVEVPIAPTAGVMVTLGRRYNNMVINRLGAPADGDLVVPIRNTSVVGTTSWRVADPDAIEIPDGAIAQLLKMGETLMPILGQAHTRGVMAVARPLIAVANVDERALPRTFEVFNHRASGAEGLITIAGGKTTTAREMAEKTADVVCAELGIAAPCRTKETILESYRHLYA